MLVRAKFETKTITKSSKLTGLFLCNNCVFYKAGHIIPCLWFSFKLTNGRSKDFIYILICKTCDSFYFEQTQSFKDKIAKDNSDFKNPHNSTCSVCSEHLRDCKTIQVIFSNISILLWKKYWAKKNGTFSYKNLH